MVATALVAGKEEPTPKDIADLQIDSFTEARLKEAISTVLVQYDALGATDQVAKGTEFVKTLKAKISGAVQGGQPSSVLP